MSLGASVAVGVYQKAYLIKTALVLSLACNAAAIYVFGISDNFYYDASLRFSIGFFQVFVVIFMPVWVDAFANEKQKTIWLTFLILASPLGIVFGYIMTSIYIASYESNHLVDEANPNEGWRNTFFIQCLMLAPMSFCFLLTPIKYLDIDKTS